MKIYIDHLLSCFECNDMMTSSEVDGTLLYEDVRCTHAGCRQQGKVFRIERRTITGFPVGTEVICNCGGIGECRVHPAVMDAI